MSNIPAATLEDRDLLLNRFREYYHKMAQAGALADSTDPDEAAIKHTNMTPLAGIPQSKISRRRHGVSPTMDN